MRNFIADETYPVETVKGVDDLVKLLSIMPLAKMVLLTKAHGKSYEEKGKSKNLKDYVTANHLVGSSFYASLQKKIVECHAQLTSLGLSIEINQEDLHLLSPGSFAVQFDFHLTSPWYSKDDTPLYFLENPVRKEAVFKVPEMAATGWKGSFRQACREMEEGGDDEIMNRLFGVALDDEDDERRNNGALRFFPSFFDKIELYAINPHSRKTKAGTHPIYFETVPPGSRSRFVLLYCAAPKETRVNLANDRHLIGELIKEVFTKRGFGAKTSIGFGRAEIIPPAAPKPTPAPPPIKQKKSGQLETKVFGSLGAAFALKQGGVNPTGEPVVPIPANRVILAKSMSGFGTFTELLQKLAAENTKEGI